MPALNNLDNSAVTDEVVGHSFDRALRQTDEQKYTPTKGQEDAGESPDGDGSEATGTGTQTSAWSQTRLRNGSLIGSLGIDSGPLTHPRVNRT